MDFLEAFSTDRLKKMLPTQLKKLKPLKKYSSTNYDFLSAL